MYVSGYNILTDPSWNTDQGVQHLCEWISK